MRFGSEEICNICKKSIIDKDCHRYTSEMLGMDYVFYTCKGECNKKFRGEYVEPFVEIETRFEILDL